MNDAYERDDTTLRYDTRPDLAVAALIDMLARFAEVRRPAVALSILAHLHVIASDARLPRAVRRAARHAHAQWHARLHGIARCTTMFDS